MSKITPGVFGFALIFSVLLTACGGGQAASNFAPMPAGTANPNGNIVADLGFRPETNGFNFPNYGKSNAKDLTPADVRAIYGDKVCSSTANATCILVPAGEQWMIQQNQNMESGHCFGFSVTSLLLFQNKLNPADYGGSGSAYSLPLDNNEKLQRRIAQSFVFQGFDPVRSRSISGSPNDILDKLVAALRAGKDAPETYTMAFLRADGGGGHAVTPYAIEDRGNGVYAVMIYDNNYPDQDRAILFDRKANTWNYTTTTNPSEPTSEYQGTAKTKTLFLFPTTPGLLQQNCPFCAGGGATSQGAHLAQAEQQYNEIYLDGDPVNHGHVLITDSQDRRYGYLSDGTFVTEIPEVQSERLFTDLSADTPEPTYYVPTNMEFTITIDGSVLTQTDETSVVLIGPGYDLGVDGIMLEPGQKDTLALSDDGTHLSYTTVSSESPSLILGFDGPNDDYEFEVQGVDVQGGGTINFTLDKAEGFLTLDTDGTTSTGSYSLIMNRIDDNGEQTFEHDNIELDPTDLLYIYFGNWTGNGGTLDLGIDRGSTGTITEHETLTDEN